MNYYQPQIFEAFASKLESQFDGIKVSSIITDEPATFPAVQIEQSNLPTDLDNSGRIRFANIRLRIRIYTTGEIKARTAQNIQAAIDDIAYSLNFVRNSHIDMSNLYQNSAYRAESTYTARVTEDGVLTRN